MCKVSLWFFQVCFLFFLLLAGNQTAYCQVSPVEIDGGFIGFNSTNSGYLFYLSSTPVSQIGTVKPSELVTNREIIWYVNGIYNDAESQFFTMKKIARLSGQPVIGIRNTTDGKISDVEQARRDVLLRSRKNPATSTLARALYDELKANRGVHLIGHSQGTAVIAVAIDLVKEHFERDNLSFCEVLKKLSLIKAEIYGSPVFEFTSGPSYYHRCNYEDPVCNFARSRTFLDNEIKSFESMTGYGSKIKGNTYGGNATIEHINVSSGSLEPLSDHFMDTIYLSRRPSQIPFPPPPQCTASVFLMDTSGSMADGGKWDGALQSSINSLRELEKVSNDQSRFFATSILSFAGECSKGSTNTLSEFTTDVTMLASKLRSSLPKPNGGTPLYISLDVAFEVLDKYVEDNPSLKETGGGVYVYSDGEDTCEQNIRPSNAYAYGGQKSAKSNLLAKMPQYTKIYSIGYDLIPGSKGERDLQYLAFISSGKYYNAANPRQLNRAFQKLTQSYSPKNIALTDAQLPKFKETLDKAGTALQKKKAAEASKLYRQLETDFKRDGINSPELYFNLAQSLEANDRYKGAVEYYQRYLQSSPQATDKNAIEQKIITLKQDYKDQFEYYLKVIDSDLTYLKKYYDDLFKKQNNALAAEFAGFVMEKGEFYTNLQDILEVQNTEVKNHSKDLSDGLYNLSDRVNSGVFDRDAVSLLTIPISELEELLELLKKVQLQRLD